MIHIVLALAMIFALMSSRHGSVSSSSGSMNVTTSGSGDGGGPFPTGCTDQRCTGGGSPNGGA